MPPLLVVLFLVALAVSIGTGYLGYRGAWFDGRGPVSVGSALASRLGRVPAALVITVVGNAVIAGAGLALGYLAKALEPSVDKPVFRWIEPRVGATNKFTLLNEKLTFMGNNPIIQVVSLLAVILLAFAYRRRWWLPVVAIIAAIELEKYVQKFLKTTVDRGHPPTTLGSWPSGGVMRIASVYGVILVLAVALLPRLSRQWRYGLWTGLATATVVEAFTRIYLSKHWITDAVGALPLALAFALVNVAAVTALAGWRGRAAEGSSDGSDDSSGVSTPAPGLDRPARPAPRPART